MYNYVAYNRFINVVFYIYICCFLFPCQICNVLYHHYMLSRMLLAEREFFRVTGLADML